jgi:hypothetical protein
MKSIGIRHSINAIMILLSVTAILSSLITCGKDKIVETAPGILFGVVIDSVTSIPLADVAIYPYDINSTPKFTDGQGYYSLPLMPVANLTVTCQKTGYTSHISHCDIVSSESTRVDFHLAPAR